MNHPSDSATPTAIPGQQRPLCSDQEIVELVSKAEGPLRGYFFRNVHNKHDAENLIQDTYIEVFRCRQRYDPARDFTRWVLGIAGNVLLAYLRNRRRQPELIGESALLAELSPYAAERKDNEESPWKAYLSAALNQLPPENRVFILAYYETEQGARDYKAFDFPSRDAMYKKVERIRRRLRVELDRLRHKDLDYES